MKISSQSGHVLIELDPIDIQNAVNAFCAANGVYLSGSQIIELNGTDSRQSVITAKASDHVNTRNVYFEPDGRVTPLGDPIASDDPLVRLEDLN